MRHVLKYQLPPLLWILLTLIVGYFPDLFFKSKMPLGSDKIAHAGVYFILCWLVRRAFYYQEAFPQLKKSSILGAFVFSCVYGMLDEFHQDFVPGRSSDVYNLVAGTGGALLYVAIASIVSQRKNGDGPRAEG